MQRDLETKEYRFNEEDHLHEINVNGEWKPLTGVTTILGVIAKPALIQWSANEAVKHIIETVNIFTLREDGEPVYEVPHSLLEEAKSAHRKRKETAGTWGTNVHALIERIVLDAIKQGGVIEKHDGVVGEYEKPVKHFLDWAIKNKVRFLASEKHVYSKEMFVGGIADIICEIDGKLFVGDIKTSSGIYPEHFIQCSAYAEILKEMGAPACDGVVVINLNKRGEIETSTMYNPSRYFEAFKSALNIYRLLEELKKL